MFHLVLVLVVVMVVVVMAAVSVLTCSEREAVQTLVLHHGLPSGGAVQKLVPRVLVPRRHITNQRCNKVERIIHKQMPFL